MPTLLSRLLCALAAAALALTAGLGLLAFAKYYSFIFLGRARDAASACCASRRAGRSASSASAWCSCSWAPSRRGRSTPLGSGLEGTARVQRWRRTTISHPLVLGPVFKEFSVLAPTWLSIVLPAYALLADPDRAGRPRARSPRACAARAGVGHRQRRRARRRAVPALRLLQPDAGDPARPARLPQPPDPRRRGRAPEREFTLDTRVVLAVDRFLYHAADQRSRCASPRACAPPVRPAVGLPALHADRTDRCPVPRPHSALMFQRILIAWDGSPRRAARLRRRHRPHPPLSTRSSSRSRSPTRPRTPRRTPTARSPPTPPPLPARDLRRGQGPRRTGRHRRRAPDHRRRAPRRSNPRYAHEHGFDLIVCGHHHSRRAGRLLLKGVTQDLVSAAATPVLVVGENHTAPRTAETLRRT